MKTHYTAKELAGLPGLPSAKVNVIAQSKRENWPSQPRPGKGGGREYPLSSLPEATQKYFAKKHRDSLPAVQDPAPVPAGTVPEALKTASELKAWQRECMDARVQIMRMIEYRTTVMGTTIDAALTAIEDESMQGELPQVKAANKRKGDRPGISKPTLYRWLGVWEKSKKTTRNGDGDCMTLAPRDTENYQEPFWAQHVAAIYNRGQKLSVPRTLEELAKLMPVGMTLPSKDQVYRWNEKRGVLETNKGRMHGAELKRIRAYSIRDLSGFKPMQLLVCDGHSGKGYVAHPRHGRHFHPEICAVVDAATRVIVGWSTGLAESQQTVADAVRHGITAKTARLGQRELIIGGSATILYTDRGAGNCANLNSAPEIGRFARVGITHETGLAGNPRGRGLIEIVNKTVWIPMMKRLPTYTGKDMDSLVQRKVYDALEKEVKQARKESRKPNAKHLISWENFLLLVQEAVDDYNNRPHSAHPKITDISGKRRHMTPLEMWAQFVDEGWQPDIIPDDDLEDLWRPNEEVTTRNAWVTLWGNRYSHRDLEHYHGKKVIAEYDIHDGSRIWVRDRDTQSLICVAGFESNKHAYFPVSKVEQDEQNRLKSKMSRINRRAEDAHLEAAPRQLAEVELTPRQLEIRAQLEAEGTGAKIVPMRARELEYNPYAPIPTEFTPEQQKLRDQLKAEFNKGMPAGWETKEEAPLPENVAKLKTTEERMRDFVMPKTDIEAMRLWLILESVVNHSMSLYDDEAEFFKNFQASSMWRGYMRMMGRLTDKKGRS